MAPACGDDDGVTDGGDEGGMGGAGGSGAKAGSGGAKAGTGGKVEAGSGGTDGGTTSGGTGGTTGGTSPVAGAGGVDAGAGGAPEGGTGGVSEGGTGGVPEGGTGGFGGDGGFGGEGGSGPSCPDSKTLFTFDAASTEGWGYYPATAGGTYAHSTTEGKASAGAVYAEATFAAGATTYVQQTFGSPGQDWSCFTTVKAWVKLAPTDTAVTSLDYIESINLFVNTNGYATGVPSAAVPIAEFTIGEWKELTFTFPTAGTLPVLTNVNVLAVGVTTTAAAQSETFVYLDDITLE